MTAPWNGLRAHQCHLLVACEADTPVQTPSERCRLHVVGISAEARVPPPGICGVRTGVAETTETSHVSIVNPRAMQSTRESFAIELRIVRRSRDRAHVNHPLDTMGLKKANELRYRAGGVPDGQHDHPDTQVSSGTNRTFGMKSTIRFAWGSHNIKSRSTNLYSRPAGRAGSNLQKVRRHRCQGTTLGIRSVHQIALGAAARAETIADVSLKNQQVARRCCACRRISQRCKRSNWNGDISLRKECFRGGHTGRLVGWRMTGLTRTE